MSNGFEEMLRQTLLDGQSRDYMLPLSGIIKISGLCVCAFLLDLWQGDSKTTFDF